MCHLFGRGFWLSFAKMVSVVLNLAFKVECSGGTCFVSLASSNENSGVAFCIGKCDCIQVAVKELENAMRESIHLSTMG